MLVIIRCAVLSEDEKRQKSKEAERSISCQDIALVLAAKAQTGKEAGTNARVAGRAAVARGVAALADGLAGGGGLAVGVAGAATADVAAELLLAGSLAGVLLVEGENGTLSLGVDVASTSATRVEAGRGRGHDLDLGGDARGGSGDGSTEVVTGTAAASVDEGVLGDSGMRLVDGVARHCEGVCACVCVKV